MNKVVVEFGSSKVETTTEEIGNLADMLGDEFTKTDSQFKPDADFDEQNNKVFRVTARELRAFIERFERLQIEKTEIADQQKQVMAEAKSRGYDTKTLRKIIALRKQDPQQIAEEEAVLELYKEALGM